MLDLTVHVLTWNEEFLLPYFLKHYAFTSKIVVHDNESDDHTVEIAKSDPRVSVVPYQTPQGQDNIVMRALKNICWKDDTTQWSIVCDIDEFLVFDPSLLDEYDGKQVAFHATGLEMVGLENEPLETISRGYRALGLMDKILLFSSNIDGINYDIGCHTATPACQVVQATDLRHYHHILGESYALQHAHKFAKRTSTSDRRHGYGDYNHRRTDKWIVRRFRGLYKSSVPVPPLTEIPFSGWSCPQQH